MRRLSWLCAVAVLGACGPSKPPAAIVPDTRGPERLAEADALVRAGCLDCLIAAFHLYDELRSVPGVTASATDRAARTAILAGLRERELGLAESGYFERARALGPELAPILEMADTMPLRTTSGSQALGEVVANRRQTASRNLEAWTSLLHPHINDDLMSAYLWFGFTCANRPATRDAVNGWVAELSSWGAVPLLDMRRATCGFTQTAMLERLLLADDRFAEIHYFLSLDRMLNARLDEAADELQHAYGWRGRWPVVTVALANLYSTAEDFDRAIVFYDRTLLLIPADPDTLLGKIKAFFYAGRYANAIAVTDELIALQRWHMGEVRYWRAFAEMQLGRLDAAWEDIDASGKLLVNAQVPKLAGIIAYARKDLPVARLKLEESYSRNRSDCETGFYLGGVLGELRAWNASATVLVEAAGCFEAAERTLVDEIGQLRRSEMRPDRRDRQIAEGRRRLATAAFDIAAAYYNLARPGDARLWAEKVSADEEFGARARDLLSRLK